MTSFSVVTRLYEHDPFLDIDANTSDIESLMELIQLEGGTCSSAEFINGDNECTEVQNTWRHHVHMIRMCAIHGKMADRMYGFQQR